MSTKPPASAKGDAAADAATAELTRKLRQWATRASVGVALLLIIAKLAAYLSSGSVALLSSLIDSTTDLLASLVTMYSVMWAHQPPDVHHRYGHGKAEPLAALAQAAFISGSAVLLAIEAVNRLLAPEPLTDSTSALVVMGFSIVLTLALVTFQKYVISRTRSMAIGADSLHYASDLAMNVAVIAAIGLAAYTGLTWIDSVFALGIAGWLVWGARGIATASLDALMDRELPDDDRQRMLAIIAAHPAAAGVHDLRTRTDGTNVFIELHLEFSPSITLGRAHAITDEIEDSLRSAYPTAEIVVHQEPTGIEEERLDERILRPQH